MKPTRSPQNQEPDQEIVELLQKLEDHKVEYPPELLAARRAAFVAQVKQHSANKIKEGLPLNGQFNKRLKGLKSITAEYPPELLAARRAAFIAQVEQRSKVEVTEELSSKDQQLLKLFKTIKSVEADYPPKVMAARRSLFRRQIALGGGTSLLDALLSSIRSLFLYKPKMPSMPGMSVMRTSLIVAVLMVAAFVTSLLRDREELLSPAPTQVNVAESSPASTSTSTGEVAKVICKPGYLPPLCLAKEAKQSENLTYQGNGAARPAVAKDTVPGYSGIHKAAYVNDGLYGPGASWVSKSAYSWVKIDLGKSTTINTVTFGRDRLGNFNDGDPGQFIIAVALSDNVYADGNSTNDYVEYTQVYDSKKVGFDGIVSGAETISASFRPTKARFVKITFANAGTAVDEVEVFMAQPFGSDDSPTRRPKDDQPGAVSTFIPVYDTPAPQPTDTHFIPPNTAIPQPTDTAIPPPTDPPPTDIPPTDIPPTHVPPTDIPPTAVPPTDIPPTDIPPTDIPPANTSIPLQPVDTPQATGGSIVRAGGF